MESWVSSPDRHSICICLGEYVFINPKSIARSGCQEKMHSLLVNITSCMSGLVDFASVKRMSLAGTEILILGQFSQFNNVLVAHAIIPVC